MAAATTIPHRPLEDVVIERAAAVLLLLNGVLVAAFPYLCTWAIALEIVGGEGFFSTCSLAVSRPLFPATLFLAAVDGALAVLLWRAGARARRWILLRAVLGGLGWGIVALFTSGNPYPVIEFAVSLLFLLLLGSVVLRLLFPSAFWLVVFFSMPLLIVLVYSFLTRGTYGQVEWVWNPSNYVRFFDPLYLAIFARSFRIALITTVVCFLFGYPLAYFIARRTPRWRNTLLLLLMIPFWTNFVVRTYAWKLLLSDQGFINGFWTGPLHGVLLWLQQNVAGFLSPLAAGTEQPLPLLYNEFAVIIGLVYGWITEMILPCYAAIGRVDFRLVEAAKDLYANDLRAFLRVVFPLTLPGVVAGSILVFIPSLGAYVTPDLLGGAKTMMLGNLIQQQFLTVRDWPFGAAISFVLMTIMLIGTLIYFRVGGKTM